MKLRRTSAPLVEAARPTRMLLVGVAIVAVAGVASAPASPAARPHARATATAYVEKLKLTIAAGREPNIHHVLESRGNIAVAAGVPVQVTVTNFTSEFHTFTIPALHVSAIVYPARGTTPRKSTFRFTAWAPGTFRWYCAFCSHGGKSHRYSMTGTVYAIIDPAVLLGG